MYSTFFLGTISSFYFLQLKVFGYIFFMQRSIVNFEYNFVPTSLASSPFTGFQKLGSHAVDLSKSHPSLTWKFKNKGLLDYTKIGQRELRGVEI